MSNRRSVKAIFGVAALIGFIAFFFQNCGAPNQISPSDTSAKAQPSTNSPLTVTASLLNIGIGQTSLITATGGQSPYLYQVVNGAAAGSVDSTGEVTGLATGSVLIEITDNANSSAQISISIGTLSSGTGNCITPWGQTVADGAQITVFQAATATCPTTQCLSEVQTCSGGTLQGTFVATSNSCSQTSCVYKAEATQTHMTCTITARTVPVSCTVAQYHSTICVAGAADNVAKLYICVGTTETAP